MPLLRTHAYLIFLLSSLLLSSGCDRDVVQIVKLEMADGVQINTQIIGPPGFPEEGPYPVILIRTPYAIQSAEGEVPRWTARGYVVVVQEIRGTFGSPDPTVARFEADGWGPKQDAREAIEWILAQSWCDGHIGTTGYSAPGIASMLAAGASQEIDAQVIEASASQFYGQAVYWGGVLRQEVVVPQWDVTGKWAANPLYNDFWAHHDGNARAPFITAPALHIGGWFDLFSQGAIDGFVTRQTDGGPGAKGRQQLIMGPWTHNGEIGAGQLQFPNSQLTQSPLGLDRQGIRERYMDDWLRGTGPGFDFTVMYYVMGDTSTANAPGNEWRFADTWPPEPKALRAYYLAPGGALTTALPLANPEVQTFFYEPQNPAPTLGGNNLFLDSGSFDQRVFIPRADTLVFASAPLTAPLEITGNVQVQLYIASTAVDTDFTAKFVDIYPDGRHMLFLDGIQRVRFRNSVEEEQFLPPDTFDTLVIDLWTTSLVLNTGHRIGLHISSSNATRFEPNPNTGADHYNSAQTVLAQNSVALGGITPSALYLPVSAFADVDSDGLNEEQEAQAFTDPLNSDTDGDGATDFDEIVAGTNALDPEDFPGR